MNPQEYLELAKAWGPLGAVLVVIGQAFLRRTPNVVDQEEAAIENLRKDVMREFEKLRKDMAAEFEKMRDGMGTVRDRVSRLEGKAEK